MFSFVWYFQWSILFCIAWYIFYIIVLCKHECYFEWLALNIPDYLPIEFGFIIDELSVKMGCLVLFISFCVQFFALEYMRYDSKQIYFMLIIHCFTFFMLMFVFSNNLIQSFIAWEGLGFVSFALINF